MEGILKVSVQCACHHISTNKCHWENFINSFFIFGSKSVIIQFKLATGCRDLSIRQSFLKLSKFCFQIGLFCSKNNSFIFFESKSRGLFILLTNYYLKHKIPLSSTYIFQFYKWHLPLGRKGKRVHSCKTMLNETL